MDKKPFEILCVDDETSLLDLTKIFLEKNGDFRVSKASSAYDALNLMKKQRFDAIVSDYEMQGMSGIDLLKSVRTTGDKTAFIIFTGRGREDIVIEAINNDADFYLQKGGDPKAQFLELRHKILAAIHRRRADSALRESEERYRNVVEGQTEFISRFLPDGTHVFVNEAYCRYFSRSRVDIIGKKFIPRIPDDDLLRVRDHFASLRHTTPVGFIEHRIIMDDGSIRWQRWNDQAIFRDDGTLVEYQSVGRDITELKLAEEAKRESDQRLQAIIQGSPVLHFFIDKNHRIIHWNHALEAYSRIPAHDVIGTKDHWKAFYPNKRPCLVDLLIDGREDEISRWYGEKSVKLSILPNAYGVVDFFPDLGPKGVWLFFTAAAIRDETGEIIGGVETLEDITPQKEAEIALEKTTARLREIIEHLPDPTFAIDRDGVVIAWNKAIASLSGWSAEMVLGRGNRVYSQAFYGGARPMLVDFFFGRSAELARYYSSMKREGDAITAETGMIPFNGRTVFFWGKASPLYDTDGSMAGAIETIHDITAIREAAEKLTESEERYRLLAENATDVIWTIDRDMKFTYMSPSILGVRGIPAEDMMNEEVDGIFSRDSAWLLREIRDEVRDLSFQKRDIRSYRKVLELAFTRRDGPPVWTETVITLLFNAAGVPDGLMGLSRDITERKEAERTIQEKEAQYRDLIETSPDALVITDEDGRFLHVNKRVLSLYKMNRVDEIIGRSIYEFISEKDHPSIKPLVEVINRGQVARGEFHLKGLDGLPIPVEVHAWRLTGEGEGRRIRYIAIIRDISERIKAEADLRESEERYRAMFLSIPSGVAVCHAISHGEGFIFKDFNPAAERITQKRREDIVGHNLLESFPEMEISGLYSAIHRVYKTGVPDHVQPLYSADETMRGWKEYDLYRLPGGDIVMIFTDVSDRMRIHDQLIAERDLAISLSHATSREKAIRVFLSAAITISGADAGAMYILNKESGFLKAIAIDGFSPDFLTGSRKIGADSEITGFVRKNTSWYSTPGQVFEPAIEGLTREKITALAIIPVLTPAGVNGCILLGSRHYTHFPSSSRDAAEMITAQIGITLERIAAEEVACANEEKYRTLVENIQLGIYRTATDTEGHFLFSNPAMAHILGYESPADLEDVTIRSIYLEKKDWDSLLDAVRRKGEVREWPLRIRRKDGEIRWIALFARGKVDPSAGLLWIDGIVEDITERKRLEEEINEKNVELERYLSTLKNANTKLHLLHSLNRHDILNQVTLLQSYVECARGISVAIPPPLETVLSRIDLVSRTISTQIEFSRNYQEIGLRTPEWQDVHAVITSAVSMIPGLTVRIIPCCSGIQVFGDPLLVKAFFNLIENAIRHGDHTTQIRFTHRIDEKSLIISCEDDGAGIPLKEKEIIFTHGYGKHTGYGLFLIREILAITRITIRETGEPGRGARFEIIVPEGSYRMVS